MKMRMKHMLAMLLAFCLLAETGLTAIPVRAEETDEIAVTDVSETISGADTSAWAERETISSDQPVVSENTEIEMQEVSVSQNEPEGEAVKILFVGNSFTSFPRGGAHCSVPEQLEELAGLAGKNIKAECVANGAAKLRFYAGMSVKHWSYYQELVEKLVEDDWDYVVLQEQSVLPAYTTEAEMEPAVASLQKMIGRLCPQAKLLLYMTHGYESYGSRNYKAIHTAELQQRIGASYMQMGEEYGIDVVPVGMQFQRVNTYFPSLQLLGADAKHPAPAGYFVAACCFYQKLCGDIPDIDARKLTTVSISQTVMKGISLLVRDSVLKTAYGSQVYLLVGEKTNMQVLDSALPVSYKSLDKSVATVDEKGNIKAVADGTAVIVAKAADGRQGFCTVSVSKPLSFGRTEYEAGVGDSICIMPQYKSDSMEWRSSNKKVAVVGADGTVYTKKAGKTRIRVTDLNNPDSTASYVLSVTLHTPQNVQISLEKKLPKSKKQNRVGYTITWDKVSGAARYQVCRSKKKKTGYKLIGRTDTTAYTDKSVKAGQVWYYKVVATEKRGKNAGGMSDHVKGCGTYASLKKVFLQKNGAVIRWRPVKGAGAYYIYRKQNKGAFKCIGTVSASGKCRFKDQTRKKGKKYTYKVVAM